MGNLLPIQTPQWLILRRLLLLEIALLIFVVILEFTQPGSLPPLLQQYLWNEQEAPLSITDGLFLGFGVPLVILYVVAWVALWKNWRSGRRLYTFGCVGAILLNLLAGPTIYSAFSSTLDTVAAIVTGAILGMLYFSDLRHRYETKEK